MHPSAVVEVDKAKMHLGALSTHAHIHIFLCSDAQMMCMYIYVKKTTYSIPWNAKSRGCQNKFLVTHKQSIEDMRNKHTRVGGGKKNGVTTPSCFISDCYVHVLTSFFTLSLNQLIETQGEEMCEQETFLRPEYEYNWNVLPSQCCPGRGMN